MSNRKRLTVVTPASENSAPSHVISLEELENAHKSPDKVKEVFVKSLGGVVYSRPISAGIVADFLDMASKKDDVSQGDFIRVLSDFAYAALCNKDGSDFLPSPEHAKRFSVEVLSEICAGIADGGESASGRKKGSRR